MLRKDKFRGVVLGLTMATGLCLMSCSGTQEKSNELSAGPATSGGESSAANQAPKALAKLDTFEIDTVESRDGGILVTGHAALPNLSDLIVSVAIKTKTDDDPSFSTDAHVEVVDGKWKVLLDMPKQPEFFHEPHLASASWTPVGQRPEVLVVTGENGERLSGPHAKKAFKDGAKMFDVEKVVRLNLGAPPHDSLPDPAKYGRGTPERAVADVVSLWKRHDWDAMAHRVQDVVDPSFAHKLEMCKSQFDFWEVHSATITKIDMSSDPAFNLPGNLATVTLHIKASTGLEAEDEDMSWVVLRLDSKNRPSSRGRWGVNIEALARR